MGRQFKQVQNGQLSCRLDLTLISACFYSPVLWGEQVEERQKHPVEGSKVRGNICNSFPWKISVFKTYLLLFYGKQELNEPDHDAGACYLQVPASCAPLRQPFVWNPECFCAESVIQCTSCHCTVVFIPLNNTLNPHERLLWPVTKHTFLRTPHPALRSSKLAIGAHGFLLGIPPERQVPLFFP